MWYKKGQFLSNKIISLCIAQAFTQMLRCCDLESNLHDNTLILSVLVSSYFLNTIFRFPTLIEKQRYILIRTPYLLISNINQVIRLKIKSITTRPC